MKIRQKTQGYYRVTIESSTADRIMRSNNERAFILSQLQDLLSPRILFGDIPAFKQLSSCIDLLAFSIQDSTIEFILFSIDKKITLGFVGHIVSRLTQYQSENQYVKYTNTFAPRVKCRKLNGPHHALEQSIITHLSHDDWEYDRYSSIGFYLHDRRGDWMRTWRLSQLYQNDNSHYRSILEAERQKSIGSFDTILQTFAP